MAQPFVHDLIACLRAPTSVLSGADGQIRANGAQGLFHDDVRHVAELVVLVDDRPATPVGAHQLSAAAVRFVTAPIDVGDPIADPTVRLERTRTVHEGGTVDEVALVNDGRAEVAMAITVRVGVDLATLQAVKQDAPVALVTPTVSRGATWRRDGRATIVDVAAESGAPVAVAVDGAIATFCWQAVVAGRTTSALTITVTAEGADPTFTAAPAPGWADRVRVRSRDPELGPLLARSLDDVGALLLADADDVFAAAGTPWFMTLFGRDSLWTARFLLPVDVTLAGGTLRALARRQGRAIDGATAAAPGKILHEVRTGPGLLDPPLPPVYYGSVDATPLWISLLHDAWCWGLPDDEVIALLDPLAAAVGWLLSHDRFLAYHDTSGVGLANQGWKDSGDSIQDGRGTIADAPITLCEVQGYAHRAALDAARLLDAFGRPGADDARAFATRIAIDFRAAFWTGDGESNAFPAVALDGQGRAVDTLTSNIGHLPATGILDVGEIARVAGHLAGAGLDSGCGLRTMTADHPRFNPLGYHTGSVWPHDTAIAVAGLVQTDHAAAAAGLVEGLLVAARAFDERLPELFGGWPRHDGAPLPYPAACRPQAWAAASAVVLLQAALGLAVDVPAGRIDVRPDPAFAALYPLSVEGLRIGEHRLDIAVDAEGRASIDTTAAVTVGDGAR